MDKLDMLLSLKIESIEFKVNQSTSVDYVLKTEFGLITVPEQVWIKSRTVIPEETAPTKETTGNDESKDQTPVVNPFNIPDYIKSLKNPSLANLLKYSLPHFNKLIGYDPNAVQKPLDATTQQILDEMDKYPHHHSDRYNESCNTTIADPNVFSESGYVPFGVVKQETKEETKLTNTITPSTVDVVVKATSETTKKPEPLTIEVALVANLQEPMKALASILDTIYKEKQLSQTISIPTLIIDIMDKVKVTVLDVKANKGQSFPKINVLIQLINSVNKYITNVFQTQTALIDTLNKIISIFTEYKVAYVELLKSQVKTENGNMSLKEFLTTNMDYSVNNICNISGLNTTKLKEDTITVKSRGKDGIKAST